MGRWWLKLHIQENTLHALQHTYIINKRWMMGEKTNKEEKCILTYHVDASRVLQAAHPLQWCHPDSCPLENYTTIAHKQTHVVKSINLAHLSQWMCTDCRCDDGCHDKPVKWRGRALVYHVVSWQLSLNIQKENQDTSDDSKPNRPCGIAQLITEQEGPSIYYLWMTLYLYVCVLLFTSYFFLQLWVAGAKSFAQ